MKFQELIDKHQPTLNLAVEANANRAFFAHFPEAPSGKIYGETANADGEAAFKARLNAKFFDLVQNSDENFVGEEESPYGFPLGIEYPAFYVENLVENAQSAWKEWRSLSPAERAVLLIESLEQAKSHFFEIAYATQHTTGQNFMMSFQASGPHAFDRALEAVAIGYSALTQFTDSVEWTKPMGKFSIVVQKKFRAVPKGIGVVVGCSTFPTWNSTPGIFANLITGNPVIVKPHPKAVLPIAILVASIQKTLVQFGVNPHIIQIAPDSSANPNTLLLCEHPAVKLIDYTGGSAFGTKLELLAGATGKICFTEKSGVNPAILESTTNLDAVLDNLAFGFSLYSGQMCTTPQNVFINKNGVREGDNLIPYEEVINRLINKINGLAGNEKMAATFGAIQNPATIERIKTASASAAKILRESSSVAQVGFPDARTASPLVLETQPNQTEIYGKEWFGPIVCIIPTENFEQSLALVEQSILTHGALTTLVHTTDSAQQNEAEERILNAGAPIAFNFTGFIWVNQSAAFSDFHGAGGNPAGNCSFADLSFVANRFNMLGTRTIKN